ncbi:hypothetical protein NDU88_000679 [Pleurodeles waltl]|uniref:Major facilitator superfamily (MFS) profile domain-containing protein n=1 Tax=Pleurodeles waltl TaxID=8319 RepID=A0AAV7R6R4_PLEWA|nr:hypothetical protein NDU88_000679 [Pleurodeles waltl]
MWDLVCEQKWLNKASSTFFFIGVTVGAILIGYLSDRYGRRTMLLVSFVFVLVFGMVAAASINYPMLIVFRSLSGVFLSGVSMIALGAEWVDIQHRTLAVSLISLCWSIGTMLLSLVAYLIRDWRWLLVAVTSPCILGIISMWWLPESARWLLTKGKVKEAHTLLARCSSVNGQAHLSPRVSIEVLSRMAENENTQTNYSYLDMFKTPVLRKISICAGVVWFGVAFSYYGISLNITGFELDVYLTQFLYGAIELPFKLSIFFFMNKSGRRHSVAGALLLSGFFIGANTVIPVSLGALQTTIAILAKGFSEAAFTAIDLLTTELYPTVLRQNGLGYNIFLARIGVSLAPMVLLLDEVWKFLPQVIFASAAILSGIVTFAFPETLNVRLPETVKDVEGTQNLKPKQPNGDPEQDLCMDAEVLMTV